MSQSNPSSSTEQSLVRPDPVGFWEAFLFWLKLGFVSFGGPAGQIAIMYQELLEKRRWLSEKRFLHALNYCMLLPGPEAQQLATYIGWLMHRSWGGVVAGGLFVLPPLLFLIGLSWIYMAYGHLTAIAGVLYGIKPAVTAIVIFAAYRIGSRALKNWVLWTMAALAFLAIFLFDTPFPLIVLIAAIFGAIVGKLAPQRFATGGGHGSAKQSYGLALNDDDTPTPDHALFSWWGLAKVALAGMILWGGAIGFLCALYGWDGALTEMGWFFTKAALLTFGGAYAVLPYVYQGAVEHFQWLTPQQMIDGLALGETTPGPLIMVVTFVGFVAGWVKAVFGPQGFSGAFDAVAALIGLFTLLALFRYKIGVIPVIAASATAGILFTFIIGMAITIPLGYCPAYCEFKPFRLDSLAINGNSENGPSTAGNVALSIAVPDTMHLLTPCLRH